MSRARFAWLCGVLMVLAGLALMVLGAALCGRARPALDALSARQQDARRRRRQYGPTERIEPTL